MDDAGWYTHRRTPVGNIGDHYSASANPSTGADAHRPKHTTMTAQVHMVSDMRRTLFATGPDRTNLMNCTIRTNVRPRDNVDEANVWNQETRPDVGMGREAHVRDRHEQLPDNREQRTKRQPEGPRAPAEHGALQAIDGQGPEAFRPPSAVSMLPKTREVGEPGAPLAVSGPLLHAIAVVSHLLNTAALLPCCSVQPSAPRRTEPTGARRNMPSPRVGCGSASRCKSPCRKSDEVQSIAASQGPRVRMRWPSRETEQWGLHGSECTARLDATKP